jgi:2,4-dienoyl-CoA reductase-like NADH-dependent reductase (Old Yellow Enzyme family)
MATDATHLSTVSPLGSPLTLPNGRVLKNRLGKSALSEQLGDLRTGAPTVALERLYTRWAHGGAGLQITGNVMVDARSIGEPRNVIVEDQTHVAGLTRLASAARRDGTTALVQVNHPGRQSMTGLSERVVAPSAIPLAYRGVFPTPRALTHEEVLELITRFATTAQVVTTAGFDGVEIHAAHGYLISQFLSPRANQRTDDWGGDPERRRRFLLEVIDATRRAIGSERVLAVKLNSADFQRGGFSEDESLEVIRELDDRGIDLLEISGGTYEAPAMAGNVADSTRSREAYFLEFAERVRAVCSVPLMVTGGFRSGTAMEAALSSGSVDVIGLGRPLILEPELPRRLINDPAGVRSALSFQSVGLRRLDAAADLMWSQHQIHRLGDGHDADPNYGPRRAAVSALAQYGLDALRRRRG